MPEKSRKCPPEIMERLKAMIQELWKGEDEYSVRVDIGRVLVRKGYSSSWVNRALKAVTRKGVRSGDLYEKTEDTSATTLEKATEKLVTKKVEQEIAQEAQEYVAEVLKTGKETLNKYALIAKMGGFDSIGDFMDELWQFYVENHGEVETLREENKLLKEQLVEIVRAVTPEAMRRLYNRDITRVFKYYTMAGLASGKYPDIKVMQLWIKKIDKAYSRELQIANASD